MGAFQDEVWELGMGEQRRPVPGVFEMKSECAKGSK